MARTLGRYRLVEPIARGGMAEVWRAEAPGAEGFVKEVALKLVRGDHRASGDFVRMFIREARLASRLTHANVVQVFDFDQVDGQYYIAMELVRGRTLREVVDRCRVMGVRFGLARAVHVCAEVARALSYAHRIEEGGRPAGLVHRDVSPQNVLLSFEGEVKLADFGIARAQGADETVPGSLKGKLSYMAPEQARGEPVDARADVFALGAVLWELCAGRRLFARDSDAATLAALLSEEPLSPPSSWNEAVPPALDALVMGALARDPRARTASAEALAGGLAGVRHQLTADGGELELRVLMLRLWPEGDAARVAEDVPPARPKLPGQAAAEGPPEGTASEVPEASTVTLPEGRRRRRARRATLVGAVALLAALAAGSLAAWRHGRGPARLVALAAPARPRTEPVPPLPPPTAPRSEPAPAGDVAPPAAPADIGPPALPSARPDSSGEARAAPGSRAPAAPGEPSPSVREERPPGDRSERPPEVRLLEPRRASQAPAAPVAAPALVTVLVNPWALVSVDGAPAGEAPLVKKVRPGHRALRATHPTLGSDAVEVELAPGERFVWRVHLAR